MPVVPPMVSAATGAALIPHLTAGSARQSMLLLCYAMFGFAAAASAVVIALLWAKLLRYGTGPAAMIPSPKWRQRHLDMPTVPTFAMAEILARKVEEIEPGAVAWPQGAGASEERARRYPVAGLRVAPAPRGGPS